MSARWSGVARRRDNGSAFPALRDIARPLPTNRLNWLQPHEGNLIEFLFRSRAYQVA